MLLTAWGIRVKVFSALTCSVPLLLTHLLRGLRSSQDHLTVCTELWGCLPEVPTLR